MAADPKPTRKRRPVAERTAPIRSGFAAQTTGARAAAAGAASPGDVQRVIQDAVRIGYDVVGANLDQARDAAQRMSSGQYAVKDVPDDLGRLAERLLGLTRDLGSTWLDVMGMVLRDPRLGDMMRGAAASTGASTASAAAADRPVPDGSRPPGWYPVPKAADAPLPAAPVEIEVIVDVPGRACTTRATPLVRTVPGIVPTLGPLNPMNSTAPPLGGALIMPGPTGKVVVAHVDVPPDQPAGTYLGIITDRNQLPIGMVEVTLA